LRKSGLRAGLAPALANGIDYRLAPLAEFDDRLHPVIVGSVGDPVDRAGARSSRSGDAPGNQICSAATTFS